ncbi:Putative beta-xylosidase [Neolewinella maritima]|uniref:beta-glucosidase n=1 Tax=Neolewinella maritima TaxID=1383882 RepID=A0ABN8F8E8_9BACT|nr:glycoside hydrolase family 3 N-terminal domain-containing protein [Neolewinella maritima]CAH1000632.1 Putative beta-xylosidase [Neolewinella maritima]
MSIKYILCGLPVFILLAFAQISTTEADYTDLNKNGRMDPYEDATRPTEERVTDLLGQMNLEEKAGMLFINGTGVSLSGDPTSKEGITGPAAMMPSALEHLTERRMNHFNIWSVPADPAVFAAWYNRVQTAARETRLGIPVTIASDPRNHFSENIFSMEATGFTQFCETLGFAALGEADFMKQAAEVIRGEYVAVGIREALHPQVDLATEPRWPRINGAFGEDAELTARLVVAYLQGMQGDSLSAKSVACMTKHFPGGGPQKNGLDPHFEFQEGQIYPGDNFDYHLIPFRAAIEAGTAAMMPYYGVPTDQTEENVAMAYNKAIITTLLREEMGYDGVVCTDWGLVSDTRMGPVVWPARAWGVEDLSEVDRVQRIIEAGCDQFGGENRPELVVQLVEEGKLSEERIDESVRRLLRVKFALGLFDDPFVDEAAIAGVFADTASLRLGQLSQQASMTLLKNEDGALPLAEGSLKVYVENMDSAVVAGYATVVATPEEADFAIIRLNTPWVPVETDNPFAKGFHHGDLDFKGAEKERILELERTVPTIVSLYLDRPAVIPEIAGAASALLCNYGASDRSVCEVVFGRVAPRGKLPFELPSSMEAVEAQLTDVPHDSENALYGYGEGLTY